MFMAPMAGILLADYWFVKKRKYAEFAFNDIDTRLIIGEIDKCPVDSLSNVFLLLELEYMGIELNKRRIRLEATNQMYITNLLLQLLVRIINTKLLERVLPRQSA